MSKYQLLNDADDRWYEEADCVIELLYKVSLDSSYIHFPDGNCQLWYQTEKRIIDE